MYFHIYLEFSHPRCVPGCSGFPECSGVTGFSTCLSEWLTKPTGMKIFTTPTTILNGYLLLCPKMHDVHKFIAQEKNGNAKKKTMYNFTIAVKYLPEVRKEERK